MNFIRKHIVAPMAIILALLLINTSVDVVERSVFKPWEENQKNFNEIESLIELIAELGLNMEDIIPENEGEDDQSLKGKHVLKYISINSQKKLHEAFQTLIYKRLQLYYYHLLEANIFIPPPEI
jgi:hypothetical protein